MNIGRNDPCPCGSGKKYKKCCMNKDVTFDQTQPNNGKTESWSLEKVAQLTSEEIFTKLNELGLTMDEQSFVKAIISKKSAKELFDEWVKSYQLNESTISAEFAFYVIRVLAKRLAPDHILAEMLHSMMQDGYQLYENKEEEAACELWWELWNKTFAWLTPRQVSSIEQLDALTAPFMAQSYFNWVQDFEMALSSLGQKDPRYLEMVFQFTTEFRKHFPESNPSVLMNMGTAGAEALFQLNQVKAGDTLFEALSKEKYKDEEMTWIYVRWGDAYTEWMNPKTADHQRAQALYEKALTFVKDASDKQSIVERIEDLKTGA
ncbi:SEC-C domain-containing protein [Caldibacillus lycopersici]|uniref:SEC-C domain-containing protein n=1 Tax=Perspicuibacillus lycopersici TaxID=1325689 RepID=A0AAE3IU68_9BACI|nr:SEC-C domain-containing protein [Perspicuibacillus lycopersici]MCU9614566.1 SEC-C domain-containing protein [Perspicuibacillus lycopersici]